jgi:hypothetical protein
MFVVKKIMIFILMFAILIVLREAGNFLLSLVGKKTLGVTTARMWGLGLSLAYILTIIFSGFSFS